MSKSHPSYQTSNIFGDVEETKNTSYAQPRTHETGVMDKPAIRVHHGPGGASNFSLGNYEEETVQQPKKKDYNTSSFSLGGYEEEEQVQKQSTSSYESSESGYVQPRTHETGVSDNRRFIKVHHAPGGQSSFSLGGNYGYEEETKPKKKDYNSSSFSLGGYEEEEKKVEETRSSYSTSTSESTSGSYVQPRTHETGVSDNRRFIKVHHAPGGQSSFSLGGSYPSDNTYASNENKSSVSNDAYDPYATSSGAMSKGNERYNVSSYEKKQGTQSESQDWWSSQEESVSFVGGSKKTIKNLAKKEEETKEGLFESTNTNNNVHTSVKTSNPPGGRSTISFW